MGNQQSITSQQTKTASPAGEHNKSILPGAKNGIVICGGNDEVLDIVSVDDYLEMPARTMGYFAVCSVL
jgi:hypothetical protein